MTLVATTFDPNNKGANVTLSSGNLTATMSGVGNVRATRPCSGLVYFEITPTFSGGTPRVGLSCPGGSLANNLGADNFAIGYDAGGTVVINGATAATIATWATTNTICVAFNPTTRLVWFRVGSGNWNNDVIGNQNPVGSVGGISLATMSGSSWMPAAGSLTTGPVFVAAFLAASFAQTAPTGYVAISSVSLVAGDTVERITSRAHAGSTPATPGARPANVNSKCGGVGFSAGNVGSPLGSAVSVSGVITQLGSNVAKLVCVYDTLTNKLIGSTTSNPSTGAFNLLCNARSKVYVVAFDPTTYQAQVYDNITPA